MANDPVLGKELKECPREVSSTGYSAQSESLSCGSRSAAFSLGQAQSDAQVCRMAGSTAEEASRINAACGLA